MNLKHILPVLMAAMLVVPTANVFAAERPHGLEPADDMPAIPDLGGLRYKTFKNGYGQTRHLSESVVLRQSSIKDGKASVVPGGLYYLSEVKDEVRPLMRDPFLVLGEHTYLVDLKRSTREVKDITVKRGEKLLVDQDGYRLWFDYATDHYDTPYVQLALISPAGHWPLEFPISSHFPEMSGVFDLDVPEGESPQIDPFYMDKEYLYGASRFDLRNNTYEIADFSNLKYPVIDEATFSMSRPWVLDLRQDDFRWYKNKRIYAFRQPSGFLVRVTDFSGSTILGEKLVRPHTPQGYKDRDGVKDEYTLSLPEHDMRIEITMEPEFMKNSDLVPWSNDVPYGWMDGILSFVVYSDLFTVKRGEAWPLDPRFKVGLEANLLTGNLQRLVLENAAPFTLSNDNPAIEGPTKWSHVWNRPAFKFVADNIEGNRAFSYYLRDSYFQRTDNMVFDEKKGRKDVDFFVGRSPTLMPILEDTFLTRLADTTFGTVVQPSHFTSFPKALSDAAFYGPDHTAPFQGRMRGFGREQVDNNIGEKLTSAEALVIRGSYVDWRNNRIVIPKSGLYYTSRNARNVRTTRDESFYLFGKRAYIASFDSSTYVRKNFDIDFWKLQPTGDLNPIFWQDTPIGENNKMLRYTQRAWLDDRPMALMNIIKYSGNNFGAPFLMATGLDHKDSHNRYAMWDYFAEGATWVLPEFIGDQTMRVKEFGTPFIRSVSYSFTKPERTLVGAGESATIGDYTIAVHAVDSINGTVDVEILDKAGKSLGSRQLGPLNAETRALMPQHQRVVDSIQFYAGSTMVEMDVQKSFEGEKAGLRLFVNVETLSHDQVLPSDARFMVRPDVCGHCYQLNELLFDNPEAIILDKDNPRFEGPKGPDGKPMFTIVIDHFDGEMIQAWHIEAEVRGRIFKSDNLAFYPRNNVDCLIGVNGTIEGFLRASMLERVAYQEYWRTGLHLPIRKGLEAWYTHLFQ